MKMTPAGRTLAGVFAVEGLFFFRRDTFDIAGIRAEVDFIVPVDAAVDIRVDIPGDAVVFI